MEMVRILITAFVASHDLMCCASDYFKMSSLHHSATRMGEMTCRLRRFHASMHIKA